MADNTKISLQEELAKTMFADTNNGSGERWEEAEQITRDTYMSNAKAALMFLSNHGLLQLDGKVWKEMP